MGTNYYDVMQVCLSGHIITDSYNKNQKARKETCPDCGKETIIACPNCSVPIRGRLSVPGITTFGSEIAPQLCPRCNHLFPWAEDKKPVPIANSSEWNRRLLGETIPSPEPEKEGLTDAPAIPIPVQAPSGPARLHEPVQEQKPAEVPLLKIDPPSPALESSEGKILNIFNNFPAAARQMRFRYSNRETLDVEDSHDAADLLRVLLSIDFQDVHEEEYLPAYSAEPSRAILVDDDKTAVVAKKTAKGFDHTVLAKELNEDIKLFLGRCSRFYCLVYDPEGRMVQLNDIDREINGMHIRMLVIPRKH